VLARRSDELEIVDACHIRLRASNRVVYVGCMHLDDIPSLPHHMSNMVYWSSEVIPLTTTVDELLCLCKERRLPRLKKEMRNMIDTWIALDDTMKPIMTDVTAIIGGDFNEPSHLDLEHVRTPVSSELVDSGFIDTYRSCHPLQDRSEPVGSTWPAGLFYQNEPQMRIDFIYTKNVDNIVGSRIVCNDDNFEWSSDHKMVVTDVEL
jgi:endonuclease/exonuclease/phosphatase family metal-dependent hydrolase